MLLFSAGLFAFFLILNGGGSSGAENSGTRLGVERHRLRLRLWLARWRRLSLAVMVGLLLLIPLQITGIARLAVLQAALLQRCRHRRQGHDRLPAVSVIFAGLGQSHPSKPSVLGGFLMRRPSRKERSEQRRQE